MKHKHADLIHQWADGQTIQYRQHFHGGEFTEWADDSYPDWDEEDFEFRIKPEEKKPVVRWLWACKVGKNHWSVSGFATEEEARAGKYPLIKLEWSRTEFTE